MMENPLSNQTNQTRLDVGDSKAEVLPWQNVVTQRALSATGFLGLLIIT